MYININTLVELIDPNDTIIVIFFCCIIINALQTIDKIVVDRVKKFLILKTGIILRGIIFCVEIIINTTCQLEFFTVRMNQLHMGKIPFLIKTAIEAITDPFCCVVFLTMAINSIIEAVA